MKIVALETIKYMGKNRVPGTDSAVFDCAKDIAEGLIQAGCAALPQTLEQAGRSVVQQKADEVIKAAEEKADAIIEDAEAKAAELVKVAEEKAAEIMTAAEVSPTESTSGNAS